MQCYPPPQSAYAPAVLPPSYWAREVGIPDSRATPFMSSSVFGAVEDEKREKHEHKTKKKKSKVKHDGSIIIEELSPARIMRKSLNSCSQKVKDYNKDKYPLVQCLFDALLKDPNKSEHKLTSIAIQVMCDIAHRAITPTPVKPSPELQNFSHIELVNMVKKSQRNDLWNKCWKQYCSSHAPSRRRDPAAHTTPYLKSAITYCIQEAAVQKAQNRPGLAALRCSLLTEGSDVTDTKNLGVLNTTSAGLMLLFNADEASYNVGGNRNAGQQQQVTIEEHITTQPEQPHQQPKQPIQLQKQQEAVQPKQQQQLQAKISEPIITEIPEPAFDDKLLKSTFMSNNGYHQPPLPDQSHHSNMNTNYDPPSHPGSAVHSRTTSIDVDWSRQIGQMMRSHPHHDRTLSMESMPQLLSGSPMPRACHSRQTSMGGELPPMSHSPRQRVVHHRMMSTDSQIHLGGGGRHTRQCSMDQIPSLASESPSASPFDMPTDYMPSPLVGCSGAYPESPLTGVGGVGGGGAGGGTGRGPSGPGWQQQIPEPYQSGANEFSITLQAVQGVGPLEALAAEWGSNLELVFESVDLSISRSDCTVTLTTNTHSMSQLHEAATFVMEHYLIPINPPVPDQQPIPLWMSTTNDIPDVAVNLVVETMADYQQCKEIFDVTEGGGWIPQLVNYCGQVATIIRYDQFDQRTQKCRLQFHCDMQVYSWPIAAMFPIPQSGYGGRSQSECCGYEDYSGGPSMPPPGNFYSQHSHHHQHHQPAPHASHHPFPPRSVHYHPHLPNSHHVPMSESNRQNQRQQPQQQQQQQQQQPQQQLQQQQQSIPHSHAPPAHKSIPVTVTPVCLFNLEEVIN